MPIVQATVPVEHLATTVRDPNSLTVEYSTDILLPIGGPYLVASLRRDYLRALLKLNDVMLLARDIDRYANAGGKLRLDIRERVITPRKGDRSGYGNSILYSSQNALNSIRASNLKSIDIRASAISTEEEILLSRIAAPNEIYRELFDVGLITGDNNLFSEKILGANNFSERLNIVLEPLLKNRSNNVPDRLAQPINELAEQAIEQAQKQSSFLSEDLLSVDKKTRNLIKKWMIAYQAERVPKFAGPLFVDIKPIGFPSSFFVREWAFNRRERMVNTFGTPTLHGPLIAEPVTPQGSYKHEAYTASRTEMTIGSRDSRRITSREAQTFSKGSLRQALNRVYYSGTGALDQLTSQASNSLLREERRAVVEQIVREVSDERERSTVNLATSTTSTTVTREAVGVDALLSATHHHFNVAIPINTRVEMYDVGLTWAPRIFNPFFNLRRAIYKVYEDAYNDHRMRYYVATPTQPPEVFEQFMAIADITMEGEEVATEEFTIDLPDTSRTLRPDLNNARVTWNQDESFWNDDPDHFTARLENLFFSGSRITGEVRLETDDGGADFEGTAHIEVPVLRFSQETLNALAQHALDLADSELQREALAAQARQYASIKQREFIELHARQDNLEKIVFEALIKQVCSFFLVSQYSYFQEIIKRTIDWTNVKIEFESVRLNALAFPEFPPDHFVNSLGVRFFLPIIENAEELFFDTLEACGSFQVRQSVEQARTRIEAERDRLEANGPDLLDEFDIEMAIGEHVEAVMSNHDLAR